MLVLYKFLLCGTQNETRPGKNAFRLFIVVSEMYTMEIQYAAIYG